MRKIISLLLILIITVAGTYAITPAAALISRDSMRTKWANGKKFLMHKVAKGETFYSISRDYKVDVKDLMNANKGVTSLKTGQIIHVPVSENYDATPKQTEENEKIPDAVKEQTETQAPVAQQKSTAVTVSKNIYHTVKKGETLSAIAHKYNVPANEIAALNNLKKNQININQKLLIKKGSASASQETMAEKTLPSESEKAKQTFKNNPDAIATKYHTVIKGETLYGISKKYDVSSKDVIAWNSLKNNEVKIGQQLIVKKEESPIPPQETVRTKVTGEQKMDTPKTAEVETKVNAVKEATTTNVNGEISSTVDKPAVNQEVIDQTTSGKNIKQSIETGEAAWVNDGDLNPSKYFGLHRTAPIGTIMKVTNRMNGKYVFVKVIGVLPGTGDNEKLIIKISKAAAERLGVIDPTFQCELNYAFAAE